MLFVLVRCAVFADENSTSQKNFWTLLRDGTWVDLTKKNVDVVLGSVAEFLRNIELAMARFTICKTPLTECSTFFNNVFDAAIRYFAKTSQTEAARGLLNCFNAQGMVRW